MVRFEVTADLANRTAEVLAEAIRHALATNERCSLALSGGHGPGPAFLALARKPIDFSRVDLFQVDERVAPRGHPDRNLTLIENEFLSNIGGDPPTVYEMPVDDGPQPERYARLLPPRLDVVHLGMGPDGHTASLVPDDPVLEVRDRSVAMSGPYQGYVRMTLTYPVLDAAEKIVFMIDGDPKREALHKLERGDESIPAARVRARDVLVLTDIAG